MDSYSVPYFVFLTEPTLVKKKVSYLVTYLESMRVSSSVHMTVSNLGPNLVPLTVATKVSLLDYNWDDKMVSSMEEVMVIMMDDELELMMVFC